MNRQSNEKTLLSTRGGSRKAAIAALLVIMVALPVGTGLSGDSWTVGAVLNDPSWEYGENARGDTVWATGLDAPANRPECSYIDSSPLPGDLFLEDLGFPALEIRHSYEMDFRLDGPNILANDAATVLISKDDGDTWELAPMRDYTTDASMEATADGINSASDCFQSLPGDLPLTDRGYYTVMGYDRTSRASVGPILPDDTVIVRLAFWSQQPEHVETRPDLDGWEIRSANLGGVDLLGLLPLPQDTVMPGLEVTFTGPNRVYQGETTTYHGRLTLFGVGLADQEVVIEQGGVGNAARVTTDASGSYRVELEFPESGIFPFRARGMPDSHFLVTSDSIHIKVDNPYDVTLSGRTQLDPGEPATYGGFFSYQGTGVASQEISVLLDGEPVATAVTDDEGWYSLTLDFASPGSFQLIAGAFFGDPFEVTSDPLNLRIKEGP